MRPDVLVLGLGNELFSDEGAGVVAARRIGAREVDVEVVDGGTLGLALLPTIEGRGALLVLDAVASDDLEPGRVVVYGGEELRREARLLYSAHQLGVTEVLAAADLVGSTPAQVAAVGVVPASVETGYGLSPVVAAALPKMVDEGLAILRSWGVRERAHA
ncbi:MAG: HyaD/HybD family hydrogenase maturation endopeptidase [Acidimicrobiia bacterium]